MKRTASLIALLSGIVSSHVAAFTGHQLGGRKPVQMFGNKGASAKKSALTAPTQDEIFNNSMVPSTSSWKKSDDLWNQEWHDAFIRSGFVDFTPPLTDFLFCLMVGDSGGGTSSGHTENSSSQLPWQAPPIQIPINDEQPTFPASVFLKDDVYC